MKTLFRLFCLIVMLSGWVVAAFCAQVIRIPNPDDPSKSKFVILPKERIGLAELPDTYIDARGWTLADLSAHRKLVLRMIDAGMSHQLQYLVDLHGKDDVQTQLTNLLLGFSHK